MGLFTKAQIDEIRKKLFDRHVVRDSDFDEAGELVGDEQVAILQGGQNMLTTVREIAGLSPQITLTVELAESYPDAVVKVNGVVKNTAVGDLGDPVEIEVSARGYLTYSATFPLCKTQTMRIALVPLSMSDYFGVRYPASYGNIPAEGGTNHIYVDSNIDWTVTDDKPVSWLSYSPASGTENGMITVTASEHTGRKIRSHEFTISGSSTISHTATVRQNSTPVFFIISSNTLTGTLPSGKTTKTITGTSNAEVLSVAFRSGTNIISGATVSINGGSAVTMAKSGNIYSATLSGDPGASSSYTFSIKVTVASNKSSSSRAMAYRVSGDSISTSDITVSQEGVTTSLSVSPASVSMKADGSVATGSTRTITIISNADWTVS